MSPRNLDEFFRPRSIALIGASDRPRSVGRSLLENLLGGFEGEVYPVNPRHESLQGVRVYRRVADLPRPPDLAVIATPALGVPSLIDELGAFGVRAAVVISAGFRESGAVGGQLERELAAAAARSRVRILGPNCVGFIVPECGLNATFVRGMPTAGRVAFLSQSGALCSAMLDWAAGESVGFSCFVSVGNMVDVDFADLIDYLADDAQTEAIVLYVEAIERARAFLSAARAVTRRKPIVAYKAGRSQQSAAAAASHTGALAGLDDAYQAAFRRAAIVRVDDGQQLVDCAELLARRRPPRGPRLAIVTNAGGPGVMAADALTNTTATLAELAPATIEALGRTLPPAWSHHNPVDVLGDAPPERMASAARAILEDDAVDGLLAIVAPQAMTDATETARQLEVAVESSSKPVLACWMGGIGVAEARSTLNAASIPTFDFPEEAVRAFGRMVEYGENLQRLNETPRLAAVAFARDEASRHETVTQLVTARDGLLTEPESKALLDAYGIPNSGAWIVRSRHEAEQLSVELGFPLVLKVLSLDITHKSDVGGVRLNLRTPAEVGDAFDSTQFAARQARPEARLVGAVLQRSIAPQYALEVIVGSRRDPTFGPLIMVGHGGVTAELQRDCSFELPPLDGRLAQRMLERLRCWPLFLGYRNRPPLAVDALVECLLRYSTLIVECPQIVESDINPLLVSVDEAVALDARFAVHSAPPPSKRYEHLAIAPYPERFVRPIQLADGAPLVVRPIRPEDEPLWLEMLDAASDESFIQRFRTLNRTAVHRESSRFCFVDYDREIVLVAESNATGRPELVGVARLVAERDSNRAELGMLVIETWQSRGVGGELLDHGLRCAAELGYRTIVSVTASDNARLISLLRSRGFRIERDLGDPSSTLAELTLD